MLEQEPNDFALSLCVSRCHGVDARDKRGHDAVVEELLTWILSPGKSAATLALIARAA
jgi:hypothetical protein